ncbi:PREDICTED: 3 beta-hydroxysteroid dehydrogenase/Delta 5--_4-isomerase type 1-like [Nanorana parkeri]|uniref:3 beta-hydroxysteroid dehydrogenase/Delta 5-->4-isomerase type 1-like n=1 Tax=Nanorana parkeri TaxID=125878 RepID=UPI000854EAC3|nr:PREDICTED: 3 beta-hydroxysteroid dehydrogenase/Delta 5-->4-isomerase type 1-like [Nanorana parkeri]
MPARSLSGVSCLVTGASGFVGHRIVRFQGVATVKTLQGDIRDSDFLHRSCQGVDLVIHAAAIIDTVGNVSKDVIMSINVTGTEQLLEACLQNNVQYFIYTSSMEVMGPNARGDPIINGTEETAYDSKLGFSYGQSKSLAEQKVLKANGQELQDGGTLTTCSLRPTYVYGEESQFLQIHVDQAILNGDVFHRISKKEALVNPVYVGNVAWAHLLAARAMRDPEGSKRIAGNFYFIADDTPHMSYADLNHALGKELGLGVESQLAMPLPILYLLASLMEVVSFVLRPFVRFVPPFTRHLLTLLNTPFTFSYRKLQSDVGYRPRYGWEEARQMTTNWMASMIPQRKERLQKKK